MRFPENTVTAVVAPPPPAENAPRRGETSTKVVVRPLNGVCKCEKVRDSIDKFVPFVSKMKFNGSLRANYMAIDAYNKRKIDPTHMLPRSELRSDIGRLRGRHARR